MASEQQKYATLVEAYATQQASLIATLLRTLLGIWLPLAWIGRPDLVNAAAAASAVQVDVAAARARRLARAYMLRQLAMMNATPADLPPIEDLYPRSGTPIVEVYKRPARQVEHQIRKERGSTDTPLPWPDRVSDEVMKTFEDRLTSLVEDDIAATMRDEAQKVIWASKKVIGYRRVIHPEFSKTGTCALCVVASSRFYTKSELMPLHDKCKCTISPVTKTQDLGLKLNDEDLKKLYAAAGSTFATDLKKIKVTIREHGELGPILTRRGTEFRDVATVNRESKRQTFTKYTELTKADDDVRWTGMKATSEQAIRTLEQAKRDGTNLVDMSGSGRVTRVRDIDKAIEWHRSLIARAVSHGA